MTVQVNPELELLLERLREHIETAGDTPWPSVEEAFVAYDATLPKPPGPTTVLVERYLGERTRFSTPEMKALDEGWMSVYPPNFRPNMAGLTNTELWECELRPIRKVA